MTPFDDFAYLVNSVLLGDEPTIEDFILLIGTFVAFIAFVLWCCFPVQHKENNLHRQLSCKSSQHSSSVPGNSSQLHTKNNSSSYNNYSIKNGHTYHCCT